MKFVKVLWMILALLMLPVLVSAGVYFGHTEAVEDRVEELDKTIRNRDEGVDGGIGGCSINYGSWLSGIDDLADLEDELLDRDVDTGPALDVINNSDFNDTDLTTDTMIQRCNTRFDDAGDTSYEHWIFCRGLRLPSGEQFDDFSEIQADVNQAPMDIHTVSFFHGGNIDDGSEDWLVPFLDQYQEDCRDRPTHVIWFGAFVEKNGVRQITDGNKWHITSTDWGGTNPTVLYDLHTQSENVFTGHSTASCPFDGTDTRGLYVGGQAEDQGRRITNRIGNNALYVGDNSDSAAQCFSGVASDNPANASGGGIQYEVQVSPPAGREAAPADIAEATLKEF